MRRALLLPLLLAVAACTGSAPAAKPPAPAAPAVVAGRTGPLRVEVADTPEERERGLTGRTSVPPGTGMVFRYPTPSIGRYWMRGVPVPLTAVFARAGEVVGIVEMAPCAADAPDCPTYGPSSPFDTVLETAPGTVAGLVAEGDRLTVQG